MVVLGLTGFVLFAVSAATLALPQTTNLLETFLGAAWKSLNVQRKTEIQDRFNCCGFNNEWRLLIDNDMVSCREGHPICNTTFLGDVSMVYQNLGAELWTNTPLNTGQKLKRNEVQRGTVWSTMCFHMYLYCHTLIQYFIAGNEKILPILPPAIIFDDFIHKFFPCVNDTVVHICTCSYRWLTLAKIEIFPLCITCLSNVLTCMLCRSVVWNPILQLNSFLAIVVSVPAWMANIAQAVILATLPGRVPSKVESLLWVVLD